MERSVKGADFLYLALYAAAGFGLELVLAGWIEPMLGITIGEMTAVQSIVHWLIMCVLWGCIGIVLMRVSKNKYGFAVTEERAELKLPQYLGIVICIGVSLWFHYLDWHGFKPVLEWEKPGTLKFVFQYIYYAFETFLFSLIIIFGQKACEMRFKKTDVPYGGIVLALTWGIGHVLSKGSVSAGIAAALAGFLFGAAYLTVGRDYRRTLPLLYVMFVL